MAMSLLNQPRFGSKGLTKNPVWMAYVGSAYECRVLLCPENGSGYSAHAMRLPGVVSQGETIDDALENIKEAFAAAVRTYLDNNQNIPWSSERIERTKGSEERWIVVNV